MPQVRSGNPFGRLATGAALGLFAGLTLPAARKVVMQGPSLAAKDWVQALSAEHRMMEKTFEALLATQDSEMAKREMLLMKIAYTLTKHAIEEENVIYPALAEHGQPDEARRLAEEHAQAKTLIYDLRQMRATDPRWIGKARQLLAALQKHMREEEDKIFPALRGSLSQEENAKLTKMMNWEGLKVA